MNKFTHLSKLVTPVKESSDVSASIQPRSVVSIKSGHHAGETGTVISVRGAAARVQLLNSDEIVVKLIDDLEPAQAVESMEEGFYVIYFDPTDPQGTRGVAQVVQRDGAHEVMGAGGALPADLAATFDGDMTCDEVVDALRDLALELELLIDGPYDESSEAGEALQTIQTQPDLHEDASDEFWMVMYDPEDEASLFVGHVYKIRDLWIEDDDASLGETPMGWGRTFDAAANTYEVANLIALIYTQLQVTGPFSSEQDALKIAHAVDFTKQDTEHAE
jgi:ribosomal protein L21E